MLRDFSGKRFISNAFIIIIIIIIIIMLPFLRKRQPLATKLAFNSFQNVDSGVV